MFSRRYPFKETGNGKIKVGGDREGIYRGYWEIEMGDGGKGGRVC